ncbi:uracil-DNA glycosylase family protein [Sorangium sp. So ce291]|uniref:uracil-DNA glycosylase family protein n=1 Tax=Sorangium sp. So ce291 TaxID=3133294 RepID=UPI003F5DEAEB
MSSVEASWRQLQREIEACQACREGRASPLIDPAARPLFGRFRPWLEGVLFVFEAPNLDDTVNPSKQYLTIDPETDPSGRFTHLLVTEELGLDVSAFQVTNSVLCLPAGSGGKYPVRALQTRTCSSNLQRQIDVLRPRVVAPVGSAALAATRILEDHGLRHLTTAVARPVRWYDRWLFPLFHTSMLARNGPAGRRAEQQRADWRHLRAFLVEQGVSIPTTQTESAHAE